MSPLPPKRRILVTGAARSTGRRLVLSLLGDPSVGEVVAMDVLPRPVDLPRGVEFVRTSLANRSVPLLLADGGFDTLVHLGVTAEPDAAGGRAAMKEHNVLGTMSLLAGAQHASALRRVVAKSTTAVYGSAPGDPAVWTEDMDPPEHPSSGFGKDAIAMEDDLRSFDRRRPDVSVTILRLANQVGPTVSNPLTRYFELPVLPTVFGFDPRLQFLHESDVEAVLERAVLGPAMPGTFNIAGPGAVPLSQAVRIAGKPSLPIVQPLAEGVARLLRHTVDFSPEQARFLQFGRMADTSAAERELGFQPRYSSLEAFTDFAEQRLVRRFTPELARRLEAGALSGIERLIERTGHLWEPRR